MLFAMSIVFSACNKSSNPYDTAMIVMVDETDPLPVYPTAQTLLAPFTLGENPWQGLQIKLVGITDKDINATETISLPKEDRLTGNITIRLAKVQRFSNELQSRIAVFDSIRTFPHSIIFRSIATQAASLANIPANSHYLLIYSNLIENSEVNFYNPKTLSLLARNPTMVEKQLEATAPLPNLKGLQLWLLYAPANYHQNNVYMPIARFYESVYKAHHADVHIANQFTLP